MANKRMARLMMVSGYGGLWTSAHVALTPYPSQKIYLTNYRNRKLLEINII